MRNRNSRKIITHPAAHQFSLSGCNRNGHRGIYAIKDDPNKLSAAGNLLKDRESHRYRIPRISPSVWIDEDMPNPISSQ